MRERVDINELLEKDPHSNIDDVSTNQFHLNRIIALEELIDELSKAIFDDTGKKR